jgi:hypothetical protein
MRILHSGNVANNAYNNAKLLRRAGVEADALCDERHIFSQPEWEDAPLAGSFAEVEQLEGIAAAAGWHRPDWVLSPRAPLTNPQGRAWLDERVRLALSTPRLNLLYRRLRGEYAPLRDVQGTDLGFFDVVRASVWISRLSREVIPLGPMFRSYDLVQANGLHPILTLLAAPDQPFVAFEHGTLRDLPFQDSWAGRLLSLAYRSASAIVITNPDVIDAIASAFARPTSSSSRRRATTGTSRAPTSCSERSQSSSATVPPSACSCSPSGGSSSSAAGI